MPVFPVPLPSWKLWNILNVLILVVKYITSRLRTPTIFLCVWFPGVHRLGREPEVPPSGTSICRAFILRCSSPSFPVTRAPPVFLSSIHPVFWFLKPHWLCWMKLPHKDFLDSLLQVKSSFLLQPVLQWCCSEILHHPDLQLSSSLLLFSSYSERLKTENTLFPALHPQHSIGYIFTFLTLPFILLLIDSQHVVPLALPLSDLWCIPSIIAYKCPYGQNYSFSSGHVWVWELDHKEGWVPKNRCFWTVVLEKILERSLSVKILDSKDIKYSLFNPSEMFNIHLTIFIVQPWIFIDAEAEAPVLWLPEAKSWLIGKNPDYEKDWRQEEKEVTEDEMVGWHHWLNGHEFEQPLGDSEGQRRLVCQSPWSHKESDRT